MSRNLVFSYSVAIFSMVAFSSIESLMTPGQFVDSKCDRICEESYNLKRLIGPACVKLSATVKDPYDAETIKNKSGCYQAAVQFEREDGTNVAFSKLVGLCPLKNGVTRCITMGKGEKEMLVYSFTGNGCTLLDEGHFEIEISQKEPAQGGGLFNAIYNVVVSII